jgi:uncharacterized protein DUF4276
MSHIGFIAEDISDVEVLKILAGKLTARRFAASHFVGKGCGPLKRKIPGWCKAFATKGVKSVVVVHDLDRNSEHELRKLLTELLSGSGFKVKAVVIPIEELEAWLLSDEQAIQVALRLRTKPKTVHNPETVPSPKEYLAAVVRENSKQRLTQYVNTVHNKLIAKALSTTKLSKCPSFNQYAQFIKAALPL